MRRVISAALWTSLAMSCGPEPAHEPEAPGALEYESNDIRLYRHGRRVDAFYVRFMGDPERHECGMLSERAHAELEDTLSALDPEVDYGCGPEAGECASAPRIHIEGFEHSPFACDVPVSIAGAEDSPNGCACCRPELVRASLIYWLISSYFGGYKRPFTVDGEPYVVIEPDEPCPRIEG